MDIQSLHYEFKLKMNRVDTQVDMDFNPLEIDWFLNKAQLTFIKQRFNELSNPKNKGFENTTPRIHNLSTLVVKYPLQPYIIPTSLDGVLEVDFSTLEYPLLYLVNAYTNVLSNNCTNRVSLRFTQHDDINSTFLDPFNGPSLEFIPFNMGQSSTGNAQSMYIYPGSLDVKKVALEYIRTPALVSLGNYILLDGITYPPQTLELPEHTHTEVVDLACQIAALSSQSPEYIQLRSQSIVINE